MIVVSHGQGNAFVRALLDGLQRHDEDFRFRTSFGLSAQSQWHRWFPAALRSTIERRRYQIPSDRLHCRPWREIVRVMPSFPGQSHMIRHEAGWASVDGVWHDLDQATARMVQNHPAATAVYTYEDGAAATLQAARERSLPGFYDLPIGYWRGAQRIFAEEAEAQPEWASTLDGLNDSPAKLARKDKEIDLADRIIVASTFTRDTLRDYPGKTLPAIEVIPYGAPAALPEQQVKIRLQQRRARGVSRLRVLFVGGLSQRKGLSYLFDAMTGLHELATLTVVGRRPPRPNAALDQALARHKHIDTLPPAELMQLMANHDVLVLPSLFEGFGLVLLEAMAQGIPVIATPHTAAPDLFADGEAGYIVPIRNSETLQSRLVELAHSPERLEACSLRARDLAEKSTWIEYGNRQINSIRALTQK